MAVKEKKIARAAAPAGLPEGWRMVRFDEMAQLVNDRVDNPSEAGVERYVGLEHLDPESLKIRRWGSPDDVEAQKLRFQPGDIIFGKRRAYQRKLAVADFEGICSAHAMVVRARDETVVKDFLPFFMQSDAFFDRALSISVGSLSPTINWKTLASQEFVIPPKGEQHLIAELLWGAEYAFRLHQGVLDNLVVLKSVYARSIFAATHSDDGLSGDALLNIDEVCKKVSDGEHLSPKVISRGRYLLSAKDIRDEIISFEEPKYVSEEDFQKFRRRCDPRPDDILIVSRGATIGRCHLIRSGTPDFALMGSVIQIRPNRDVIDPLFLLNYLRHAETQRRMVSATGATAQPAIYLKYLKELSVPVPSIEVQQRVAAQLNWFDITLRAEEEHLQTLNRLKKSLNKSMLHPVQANK